MDRLSSRLTRLDYVESMLGGAGAPPPLGRPYQHHQRSPNFSPRPQLSPPQHHAGGGLPYYYAASAAATAAIGGGGPPAAHGFGFGGVQNLEDVQRDLEMLRAEVRARQPVNRQIR